MSDQQGIDIHSCRATIATLAKMFQFSDGTIRNKLAGRHVEPMGKIGGRAAFPIDLAARAVFATVEGQKDPEGEVDPELLAPAARKAWYDGERVKTELMKSKGELVEIEDYRRDMAETLLEVAAALETLPDVLERKCGLKPTVVEKMQKVIDEQRETLAQRIEAQADQ